FLSRARFLAVAEFGPRSLLYHEGSRFRVARVLFSSQGAERSLSEAKVCAVCGYGHFGARAVEADICDGCDVVLSGDDVHHLAEVLRLTNVEAERVDRITCDEEERIRVGYEILTSYRFDAADGRKRVREVTFVDPGTDAAVARAVFGPAASIWRLNLGW